MISQKYKHQIWLSVATLAFMTVGAVVLYFIIQKISNQARAEGYAQGIQVERTVWVEKEKVATRVRLTERIREVKNNVNNFLCVTEKRFISNALFGSIHDLHITLTNKSEFNFQKVTLQVNYIKGDGTLYDIEYLKFPLVRSGESYRTQAPSKWRGKSVQVFVAKFEMEHQN